MLRIKDPNNILGSGSQIRPLGKCRIRIIIFTQLIQMNLRQLLLIVIFSITINNLQSQTCKSEITLQSGIGVPVGKFASNDIYDDEAGGAKMGYNLSLSYEYKINRRLGITARLFGIANKYDDSQIINNFKKSGSFGYSESTEWNTTGVLFGATYNIPVKRLNYQIRLLAGPVNLESPFVEIRLAESNYTGNDIPQTDLNTISNSGSVSIYTVDPANAKAVGVNIGAAVSYSLSRHWNLKMDADYLFSNFKFDRIDYFTFSSFHSEYGVKQPLSMINLNLGMGYCF